MTTQTRTALVTTDAPARYAKQLGSHLGRRMTLTETDRGPHLSMSFEGLEATCLMDTTAADTHLEELGERRLPLSARPTPRPGSGWPMGRAG